MIPKFNIIVPTFNSEKYIEKCIDSINEQTFNNWKLTIVDNHSSDDTVKIIKKK